MRRAARTTLAAQRDALRRELPRALDGDPEAVHAVRIAIRRLRAVLRLFAPYLPSVRARTLSDELGWLGRGVGAVRDLDVLAVAIARCTVAENDRRPGGLPPLTRLVAGRREQALVALGEQLAAPRARRVLRRLDALSDGAPPPRRPIPLRAVAHALLQPLVRRVRSAGRGLDGDAPPAALHRLRVRVKELRYASELLHPLAGDHGRGARRRLVKLQDVLGDHHDAVAQARWLLAAGAGVDLPAETLLAMGGIVWALDARARDRHDRFRRRWRRFDRRGTYRRLLPPEPEEDTPP